MSVFDHIDISAPGNYRLKCPLCGKKGYDESGSLLVKNDGFRVYRCFRCELIEIQKTERQTWQDRSAHALTPRVETPKPTELAPWATDLWKQCEPISGIAHDYLSHRHCVIPPEGSHLRWSPQLRHPPSGINGPALVALITDVVTGTPISLHRTWITATGKANHLGPCVRLLLKDHSTQGGVIRLWPDSLIDGQLGIAEGIETALSLAHACLPMWSVIDAGHMGKFPVLDYINSLVIAQDRDPAGERGALACANRWYASGKQVRISQQLENDVNDILTGSNNT